MRNSTVVALLLVLFAWRNVQADYNLSAALEPPTSKLQVHIPQSLAKLPNGYDHRDALFGVPPYGGSIQQPLYYSNSTFCTVSVSDTRGGFPTAGRPMENGQLQPWQPPYLLMVDRGECSFVVKVRNAQKYGAVGVIIADNKCMCTDTVCLEKDPSAVYTCEEQEPIMADDGTGGDIRIPSLLMFKQDADPIKAAVIKNTRVRMEMSFPVPSPDSRVEYTLWTSPSDRFSRQLLRDFKMAAMVLDQNDRGVFTPRMFVFDGISAGCRHDQELPPELDECYNLCTNNGLYCANDPDRELSLGATGADVVVESLRRICIWKEYGMILDDKSSQMGVQWWDYEIQFSENCFNMNKNRFNDPKCISDAMVQAGINSDRIEDCMAKSGGFGNTTNALLEEEVKEQAKANVFIIPSLFVNDAPIRGSLSLATLFRAICAGYARGTEPDICTACASCYDEEECIKTGGKICKNDAGLGGTSGSSGEGVSFVVFAGSMLGLTVFFLLFAYIQYRRQERRMREEVRGIVAEYMPVQGTGNMGTTSLALD